MKQNIKLGVTDRTVLVYVPDPASTDGSGKTGLAHTDMTVSYTRVETDNDVVVTDATSSLNALTNLTDAHNDWGWKEVSNTLAPGLYRLDCADAVFASGAWSAVVYVMITTSAAAASPMEFILVAYDPLDTVRLGLTALPNAAAEAAGGLYTRGTGAGQINQAANGQVDTNVTHAAGTAWASGSLTSGVFAAGAITAAAIANNAIDAATFAADVDAEFLSYIVDDATRIDASALNTAAVTSIPAILVDTGTTLDTAIAAIKVTTDKLDDTLEDQGGGTYGFTEEALQEAPSGGGGGASAADIADAVWDELTSGHAVSGSFGEQFYSIRSNTAQAGAATTITLDASASAVNDFYNDTIIVLTGGTGAGQARVIADYVGATKVATVATWVTNPDNTSTFVILPFGATVADGNVTAIKAKTDNLPSDPADASDIAAAFSSLNTKVDTIDDFLDTEVAAIKTKTDQLTFGVANTLNSNVEYVNGTQIDGAGTEADPWGPV
jgi:hypothetical protein